MGESRPVGPGPLGRVWGGGHSVGRSGPRISDVTTCTPYNYNSTITDIVSVVINR